MPSRNGPLLALHTIRMIPPIGKKVKHIFYRNIAFAFTEEFTPFPLRYLAACNRNYRVLAARTDFHKLAIEVF